MQLMGRLFVAGHGYDQNQCAEFCSSGHHFTVNGREHVLTFSTAGTHWGCADRVAAGSVPNEHGTWQYGRAGWCDGQQVRASSRLADYEITAGLRDMDMPMGAS